MRRDERSRDQEPQFQSELPPRGGVLESSEVQPSASQLASWDRADKAFDVMANTLAILTTQNGDELAGLVVSSVATVSQHPPMFSVAVRRSHPAEGLIRASGRLAINFLSEDSEPLVKQFGAPPISGKSAFAGVEYDRGVTSGSPILRGVAAFVEGKVVKAIEAGDHTLFIAEVLDGGRLTDAPPRVCQGSYKPTSSS